MWKKGSTFFAIVTPSNEHIINTFKKVLLWSILIIIIIINSLIKRFAVTKLNYTLKPEMTMGTYND
jgi:hypothetical protein